MTDESGAFKSGMVAGGLIAAVAVVFIFDPPGTVKDIRRHAVEHGYAKYELNQSTGEVEFKWEEKK